MADAELKKAFEELKSKNIETTNRIKSVDNQIEQAKATGRHTELTMAQINSCPNNTVFYESIGRMFVVEPKETILAQLQEKSSNVRKIMQKCEDEKVYLSKSLKESEDSLRELISTKRNTQ